MDGHSDFRNKRVVVMGLGRFGGGIGVTRWLARGGARVCVTDAAAASDLADSVAALADVKVDFRLGSHDESDLDGADLLVASPAVNKATSGFFQAALRRGIPWSSEMNLFLERCPARLVGITGSVGKSTTTAMVGAVLAAAEKTPEWGHGRVWLGGNIGKSLLDDLTAMTPRDVVVLELSSFQLEDAAALGKSPHCALITNIRENHLDRHGTMQSYAGAKVNIYRYQKPGDALALPFEGAVEWLDDWQERRPLYRYGLRGGEGETGRGGEKPFDASICIELWTPGASRPEQTRVDNVRLAVPGAHNLQNAAAALTIARMLRVPDAVALEALSTFPGLIHRLEFVRELNGVRWFNDSKATTADAAITALRAFDGHVVLIAGGSDKGSSFETFGRAIAAHARCVICVGDTRDRIAQEVRRARTAEDLHSIQIANTFTDAVDRARAAARLGDAVLLSPGCASYDMFVNYEQRGDTFKRIVRSWS